jgi:hypothetical protein
MKPQLLMSLIHDDLSVGVSRESAIREYCRRAIVLADNGIELRFVIPADNLKGYSIASNLASSSIAPWCVRISQGQSTSRNYFQALQWPRDLFQYIDGELFSYDCNLSITHQIANQLNLPKPKTSSIGEGGLFVSTRDIVIASQPIGGEIDWQPLRNKGYQVYEVPFLQVDENKPEDFQNVSRQSGHIDLELALISSPQGNLALLINEPFYQEQKEILDRISIKTNAQIYRISEKFEVENRAVNLIQIPNGKVAYDVTATQTESILERILGKNNLIPFLPIGLESLAHGGFRCRTNLIQH